MMFLFHSAMMIALIALVLGIGLVIWSLRNDGVGAGLAKGFGLFIIIIAILGSICASVYTVKYGYAGYFQMPLIPGEAFLFHVAQMLEIVAIAVGIILVIWGLRNQGIGVSTAKILGWIIVIVAILGLLCTTYYGFVYWSKGYLTTPISHMKRHSMSGMGQPMQKGMTQGQ